MASRPMRRLAVVCLAALALVLLVVLRPRGTGPDVASGPQDGGSASAPVDESAGDGAESGGSPTDGDPVEVVSSADGTGIRSYSSDLELEGEAERLLAAYEQQGSCLLREAGYLDLFGNVWSCTVQGPGWVDVCVVSGRDGDGSEVRVIRMDVGEWEASYGER